MFPHHCDIVIIGGGIMGCSIAYWLKKRSPTGLNIVVVERDPTYSRSSTVLSVGGLRQQFSLAENIEMSLFGADFLRESKQLLSIDGKEAPDVQFNPHGYLFLSTKTGAEQLMANHKLQIELGAKVQLLTPTRLKQKFPWISTENIELASYGLENEGWFDPWSLLEGLKRKAISQGTIFVKAEAVGFEAEELNNDGIINQRLKRVHVRMDDGEVQSIDFSQCVLAAGPQSGQVSKLAGIGLGTGLMRPALPVEPRILLRQSVQLLDINSP